MRQFLLLFFILDFCIRAQGQEPLYEGETKSGSKNRVQLSVPEKNWVNSELYSERPGNYSVLIWGHAEAPRAMPAGFNIMEEVRHLAQHHIDWYSGFAPAKEEEMEKFRNWFKQTGLRVAMGFPDSAITARAMRLGAEPSNPSMVAQKKKPWIAPIDPHYLEASKALIEERFSKSADLGFIRAFHFQDEPVGELPYYDTGGKWKTKLAADWEREIESEPGNSNRHLPNDSWDISVPGDRLAYQRFWARKFNNYQREMAEILRAQHPEIEIWSANFWFNQGSDLLWNYGEMGRFLNAIVIDSYATQQEIDFPGRGRWNAGYATKLTADLSGKPVYNHIQVFTYKGATPSVADIYEYASQTLRAGGKGLIYYAIDTPQYRYIRYTDPARWAAMLDISDQFSRLPDLKRPAQQPTGFWVSQETFATTGPRVRDNSAYAAYVLLGETIGAPFRFISDWNVEKNGEAELAGCKILYVGPAQWAPAGVAAKVKAWVNAGGTLVLRDSKAFTRQADGSALPSWQDAFGVTGTPKPGEDAEEWTVGQGRVLILKQDPWVLSAWDHPEQVATIQKLQAACHGGSDEPIWRFRLSPAKGEGVK